MKSYNASEKLGTLYFLVLSELVALKVIPYAFKMF